tara:strand:- start:421 stop:999 length:579 start_codon:yes stop_codon:yes gene_type:complete
MDALAQFGFNAADWILLTVLLVSTVISLRRGFVKEALSLVTWIVAFVVARLFAAQLAMLLVDQVSVPSVRLGLAFLMLFACTLLVGGTIGFLLGELIRVTGLSGTDRLLGMVFGFARGALIVVIAIAVLRLAPVTEDPWYQSSRLIPVVERAETHLRERFEAVAPGLMEQVHEVLEDGSDAPSEEAPKEAAI